LCAFYFAHEAAGASSARHSLRPLNFRCASRLAKLAWRTRRECGGVCVSHLRATSSRTLQPHRRSTSLLLVGRVAHRERANDVTGGGPCPQSEVLAQGIALSNPHPALRATQERASLVSTPQVGGIRKERASLVSTIRKARASVVSTPQRKGTRIARRDRAGVTRGGLFEK
jgi:hypothetical protein